MLKVVGRETEECVQDTVIEFRHSFLEVLQHNMFLSPHERRIQSTQNKPGVIPPPDAAFEIDLPVMSSSATSKVFVPLPLPNVAGHWGVAAFLTRIDAEALVHIIMLLLIERSILVIGESSHLVTACACALLDLLKPYEWASNFMPLLSGDMLDFVNSPVPFLIGMTVEDRAHSVTIERDNRVIEATAEGLTTVNLSTNSVLFTTEPEIMTMLRGCPTPT